MIYQEVTSYLDRLCMHKIKLGLEAMCGFLARVGNPQRRLQFVHLAGTNGKGTVCEALRQILSGAGWRVGCYTSPHLSSPRERFRVGENYISEEDFARIATRIITVLGGERITWFEFTTAVAFLWFAEMECDLVLLETGMGGRLDATNVVTPLVSVITSISMDHQAWLGDSIAAIAREKAGIIKKGVPVVCGAAGEAAAVIAAAAAAAGSPFYQLHCDFGWSHQADRSWSWHGEGLPGRRRLQGLHSGCLSLVQQENESLALAVLQLLEVHGFGVEKGDIVGGLAGLCWPGRMELLEVKVRGHTLRVLLDGAHNPAGVDNLAATLNRHFPGRRSLLWGGMADKEPAVLLAGIAPLFQRLVVTRPDGPRAAEPATIVRSLPGELRQRVLCERDPERAFARLCAMAEEGELIVVAGSLYLVGAIRPLLAGELV